MRPTFLVLTIAALTMMVWFPPVAAAAEDIETHTAQGTVTAVANRSITVRAGEKNLILVVDNKTVVQSRGASSALLRAAAAGRSGPPLDDLLQVGMAVTVSYQQSGNGLRASIIHVTQKPH